MGLTDVLFIKTKSAMHAEFMKSMCQPYNPLVNPHHIVEINQYDAGHMKTWCKNGLNRECLQ